MEKDCKTCIYDYRNNRNGVMCDGIVGKCENFDKYMMYQQTKVEGVGMDAPTITNDKGGKQSAVSYAFDALDGQAMFAMCKVLHEGRIKYGSDENWRKIPAREHWNHMVIHGFAWLAGDKSDDHLSHIMCRAMMLYATAVEENG